MAQQRFIPVAATPFERFLAGDAVAHFSLGDGTVSSNDGRIVCVTYAMTYPPGTAGGLANRNVRQCYDAEWFRRNPLLLFHRSS